MKGYQSFFVVSFLSHPKNKFSPPKFGYEKTSTRLLARHTDFKKVSDFLIDEKVS